MAANCGSPGITFLDPGGALQAGQHGPVHVTEGTTTVVQVQAAQHGAAWGPFVIHRA